jgi:hypothetical protein
VPRGVKEVVCAVPNLAAGGAVAGRVVLELLRADGSEVRRARVGGGWGRGVGVVRGTEGLVAARKLLDQGSAFVSLRVRVQGAVAVQGEHSRCPSVQAALERDLSFVEVAFPGEEASRTLSCYL